MSRELHEMSATVTDFNEPPPGTDAVAVRPGRRGTTYTDVHDWVTFSNAMPESKALYVVLRAHVNRLRADDLVWTSTLALARVLTYSRGDKISPFIKDLARLGAIDVERAGLHGRLTFTVNQEPPAGYTGPLTAAEWHAENKPELDRIRAEEKDKRDARRARAKAKKTDDGSSEPVHPEQGEQAVHPEQGEPVHPESGKPVHPVSGREPDVLEPDEENKKNQTPVAGATGGTGNPAKPGSAQTTIDGTEESLAPRDATLTDLANEDARIWAEFWKNKGTPIAGAQVHAKLRSLILSFLKAEYTATEIREAFKRIAAPVVPTADRLQRELAAVRGVDVAPTSGAPRGAGARVNDQWNRADDKPGREPAFAHAGGNTVPTQSAPRANAIQTTGGFW